MKSETINPKPFIPKPSANGTLERKDVDFRISKLRVQSLEAKGSGNRGTGEQFRRIHKGNGFGHIAQISQRPQCRYQGGMLGIHLTHLGLLGHRPRKVEGSPTSYASGFRTNMKAMEGS